MLIDRGSHVALYKGLSSQVGDDPDDEAQAGGTLHVASQGMAFNDDLTLHRIRSNRDLALAHVIAST